MEQTDLMRSRCRLATRACAAAASALAAATLAGWVTRQPVLLGLNPNYIPMAPNTAMAFLVLASGLLAVDGGRRVGRWYAGLGAALVGLIGLIRLGEFASGVDLAVDRWFFRFQGGWFGQAALGKMSLPTSIAIASAAGAIFSLARSGRRGRSGHLAGVGGLFAGMVGLIFALGYFFSPNAPLLYGTRSIPMALNTALCFIALGAGTVAAAGPGAFPLVRLSGPTIRARLLRIFLPLVVGTVGLVAWLTQLVTTSVGPSSAAITSAAMAVAAILVFGAICERVAGRVGGQLERAEAELQQAHDELEVKVIERTAQLSHANGELAEALRAARDAHEKLLQSHLELQRAQSRMLQQARMASLGQTAAGVAHEINNPLAFVTNNLAVLKREFAGLQGILQLYQEAEATLAEYQNDLHSRIAELSDEVDLPFVMENLDGLLERSRNGLQRIQKTVADLRDFAHLEEAEFKEADLNEGIVTTIRLMQGLADSRRVVLEAGLAPIPRITCYPAKINLAVQSLLSNAIDACPEGGKVVVETYEVVGAIEIRVSDTGCGVAPAIRDQIFDPFFTTKPIGKGTGLGLSISYGIAKDHGGTIELDSSPGQGARFTIRLPLASPVGAAASQDGHDEARVPLAPA